MELHAGRISEWHFRNLFVYIEILSLSFFLPFQGWEARPFAMLRLAKNQYCVLLFADGCFQFADKRNATTRSYNAIESIFMSFFITIEWNSCRYHAEEIDSVCLSRKLNSFPATEQRRLLSSAD